ncbi:hypothetical protein MP228_006546 [Amoeboaphelidium protococcarum]|nr:hypothetical protein MP228_006546 [Amoeboaphelidium protococcarum]
MSGIIFIEDGAREITFVIIAVLVALHMLLSLPDKSGDHTFIAWSAVSQSVDELKSHSAEATVATQGNTGSASNFADCLTPTEENTYVTGPSGPDSTLCPVIAPLMSCASDSGIFMFCLAAPGQIEKLCPLWQKMAVLIGQKSMSNEYVSVQRFFNIFIELQDSSTIESLKDFAHFL